MVGVCDGVSQSLPRTIIFLQPIPDLIELEPLDVDDLLWRSVAANDPDVGRLHTESVRERVHERSVRAAVFRRSRHTHADPVCVTADDLRSARAGHDLDLQERHPWRAYGFAAVRAMNSEKPTRNFPMFVRIVSSVSRSSASNTLAAPDT